MLSRPQLLRNKNGRLKSNRWTESYSSYVSLRRSSQHKMHRYRKGSTLSFRLRIRLKSRRSKWNLSVSRSLKTSSETLRTKTNSLRVKLSRMALSPIRRMSSCACSLNKSRNRKRRWRIITSEFSRVSGTMSVSQSSERRRQRVRSMNSIRPTKMKFRPWLKPIWARFRKERQQSAPSQRIFPRQSSSSLSLLKILNRK